MDYESMTRTTPYGGYGCENVLHDLRSIDTASFLVQQIEHPNLTIQGESKFTNDFTRDQHSWQR